MTPGYNTYCFGGFCMGPLFSSIYIPGIYTRVWNPGYILLGGWCMGVHSTRYQIHYWLIYLLLHYSLVIHYWHMLYWSVWVGTLTKLKKKKKKTSQLWDMVFVSLVPSINVTLIARAMYTYRVCINSCIPPFFCHSSLMYRACITSCVPPFFF